MRCHCSFKQQPFYSSDLILCHCKICFQKIPVFYTRSASLYYTRYRLEINFLTVQSMHYKIDTVHAHIHTSSRSTFTSIFYLSYIWQYTGKKQTILTLRFVNYKGSGYYIIFFNKYGNDIQKHTFLGKVNNINMTIKFTKELESVIQICKYHIEEK